MGEERGDGCLLLNGEKSGRGDWLHIQAGIYTDNIDKTVKT